MHTPLPYPAPRRWTPYHEKGSGAQSLHCKHMSCLWIKPHSCISSFNLHDVVVQPFSHGLQQHNQYLKTTSESMNHAAIHTFLYICTQQIWMIKLRSPTSFAALQPSAICALKAHLKSISSSSGLGLNHTFLSICTPLLWMLRSRCP